MAEYIKREAVIDLITRRYENPEICTQEINSIPAADVAPVVRWAVDSVSQQDFGRYSVLLRLRDRVCCQIRLLPPLWGEDGRRCWP